MLLNIKVAADLCHILYMLVTLVNKFMARLQIWTFEPLISSFIFFKRGINMLSVPTVLTLMPPGCLSYYPS